MTQQEHDLAIAFARQHMFDARSETDKYHWCQKLVAAIQLKEAERALAEDAEREKAFS
jgi:hypothetical protein